jgi:neutral trehalase
MNKKKLEQEAIEVLKANRRKGYTVPSGNIYPFQWKWDSGFIAVGSAHFDLEWAMKELGILLDAQWKNGFIPHIIFHDLSGEQKYFPNSSFYQSSLSDQANLSYKTTTLTQPPVEGWVLERIYEKGKHQEAVMRFVKESFAKIMAQHRYLYDFRDPLDEGLVYIQHNWESGTDNAPVWDEIWDSFDAPKFDFQRKDTSHVDSAQRPKKHEYDYYLYLIELFKEWKYQDKEIAENAPFLIQDPLFNSMLVASNNSMIRLADELGFSDEKAQLEVWNAKTIKSFNEKLFDEQAGLYRHYDMRRNQWLDGQTISGFAPLFAGIPSKQQADRLVETLGRFTVSGHWYSVPSFPPDDLRFESQRYWRGPVWVNMNWLIMEGLKNYDYLNLARKIKEDTLQIVGEQGFYEYFEPGKEKSKTLEHGYGGALFSWTAALIIDILNNDI